MKNFLTLIGANVPTAAVCTAKSPQNSGGGSSQSFTSRSIGTQSFTLQSIGAQYFTRFLGSSCRVWKYVACMLMVLFVGVGNVWGDPTFKSDYSDFTSINNSTDKYLWIPQSAVDGANWISANSATTGSKKYSIFIDPSTGIASTNNTSVNFYRPKDKATSKYLTFYLTNITSVSFYAYNSSTNKTLQAKVNGGNAITLATTASNVYSIVGTISGLNASTNYTIEVFNQEASSGASEVYVGAIKVTPASSCSAPTITTDLSTTKVEYEQNAAATPLAIETSGTSVTYQWYSNTANSATTPTPTALENCTTKTYTPSTSTTGTTYYFCVASSSTCSTTSKITPVEVKEASGGGEDPEPTCPTSGVVFSANAKTTSAKSFDNGTTEITSSDVDITGGKVYAISGQDKSKELLTNSGQFTMTNNNTIFKFELDCALAAGDRITIDGQGGTKTSNNVTTNKGLWVTSTEDRPSSAPACYGENSENTWHTPILSYIVTSTDAYVGKKTLYVHRQAGTGQNFDNVVVTRPYNISYVSAKGTAQATPTKGFEVALTQITGVEGWNHTGWTANKAVTVGTTDYAIGDEIPVSATAKLSDDTQFTAVWVEVLSPAATPSISAHPATASYTWKQTIQALTVTATVTDGGTLHYQWYKEAGENDTKVGTDANSYTPEEAGTYYVVVTNKKTGYEDASATSNNAVITIGTRPSYTVTYKDGASSLGTESVQEDASPTGYAAKQTKSVYGISGLYTFDGWYNNSDLAGGHAITNIAALVVTKDTTIYGKWTRIEAASVDLVARAATIAGDESTETELTDFKTWFTGKGYVYANLKALDNKSGNNGAYLGLKTKSDEAYVAFNVPANKRVTIKLGYMAGAAEVYINGVKNTTQALTGGSTSSGDNYADWYYDVTEESTLQLKIVNSGTCVLKAITIGDIPAQSDDATLKDLKVDGTTVDGFVSSTLDYYVELPYGTSDVPTVAGTAHDTKAISVTPTQASTLPGNATVVVLAEDNSTTKTYTVHFTVAPKLGVELIKATHTGEQTANKAGHWTDEVTVDKNTQGGGKLGENGHYFGLTLTTEKFKNGDLLCIYLNQDEAVSAYLQVYKDKGNNIIIDQQSGVKKGSNYFTLSGLPEEGIDKLYLYRTSKNMNPFVDYIAVYREMPSFFESFTVAGVAATIDETVSPKTITVEVPAVTEITALTPTYKAWANGGATVSPTTAQDFSAGAVDYTVTSAYEETTTYKVTVTKAAAIKEVVISGTLSVMEDGTTALTATVYDTNDAVASNQNVTWSVKSGSESYASVDAYGVVTGKAAGTAYIIATSVADDTKSAEVAVTVSENPCRVWSNPDSKTTTYTIGKMVVKPTSIGTLQEDMTPYQEATATNAWKLDAKDSKYAEISFTDKAQFESLTLGVSSNGSNKNYKFAVVCSSASGEGFAAGVLSATAYDAVDNDEAEALVDVELAVGTKTVRVYREYTYGSGTVGGGSSVFLYYIQACKKEFVPVANVAVADGNLAIGKSLTLLATLTPANADMESYVWTIESMTATGVTIDGNVLTAAANATEGEVVVRVLATDVLGNEKEATATINVVNHFDEIKLVTGTTTWTWDELAVPSGDGPKLGANDTVLANYISGAEWEKIAGKYNEYAWRSDSYKCYQGTKLNIETTVPGKLTIKARRQNEGDKLYVNGDKIADLTTTQTNYVIAVPAGAVKITGSPGMRIYSMTFQTLDDATPDYTRPVTIDRMGTVCVDHNVPAGCIVGAEVYKLLYWKYGEHWYDCQMVDFEQVEEMNAGEPYMIIPTGSTFALFYGATKVNAPLALTNGFTGTFDPIVAAYDNVLYGKYGVVNNMIQKLGHNCYSPANRAYIDLSQTPSKDAYDAQPHMTNHAPRKRVSLGHKITTEEEPIATGLDAINVESEDVQKVLINGEMYVIRAGHIYTATGMMVK